MVHLAIHLPDEAILRGPVQFGWMYPVERHLYTLKKSVRNKARPEGSIAEAYVADEALTFCSRYMEDVETRFNRLPRNVGFSDQSAYTVDVFGHGVNLIGAYDYSYSEEIEQLAWYVLNNCDQAEKYIIKFQDDLATSGVAATDLERRTQNGFVNWFRNHIWRLSETEVVDDDLFALASGPDIRVRSYSTCVVNGVRFNTAERDKNKTTQNSGLTCTVAEVTEYEVERMNNCLENYEKMRELGLDVSNAPFAGFGEDEHNSDDHPNVDNLEPEKDDSLQELDNVISRLIAKSSKKVTKTGGQKVQPQNQAGTLTRSNAKKASATEISNQTTEEGDAAEQNACQTEEDNIQTVLNQDGSIENGMDSADDLFDEEVRIRGPNIGKKLDKMTRSKRGKLPLVIEPGKKRPSSVMIAAKFASECNIAVRGGVPIFPKWKDYKEKSSRPMIKAYINSVCSKFEADKESVHVKRACVAMLKQAICQQRHKLKMKHFDPFPLHKVPKKSPVPSMDDAQWDTLVEYWKSEKRMLTCEKNKTNRSKVQFHQKTGSRSYEMELINLASKYQDEPPNAFDRFKDLHYSKKKGFTPTVQSAIVEMEDKINAPVQDGEEPKDVADIVHEVLAQKTKKNKFLVNVGLKRSSATEDYAESQHELQAELLQEKQTTSELKEVVKAQQMQMDEMMKKFQKGEIARAKQDEEYKKKQDETNALIRGLMSMIPASQPTR